MKPNDFNPKQGLLHLSFSNGTSFSLDLSKSYHREEGFFVDLFWEETKSTTSLSLGLHPKAGDLFLSSCALEWPLSAGIAQEVLTQGFSLPQEKAWSSPQNLASAPSLLKKIAAKRINAYDPLPHPSLNKASYQAISLRNNQASLEIKSTDESAALTVFTISNDGATLRAENQSSGYHLRHSFPAFELQFIVTKVPRRSKEVVLDAVFSAGLSSSCVKGNKLAALTQSSIVSEGNFRSIVLKSHEAHCPNASAFDTSFFSAFAKTCLQNDVRAGISLNPFVVPIESGSKGVKISKDPQFKRWSPSLKTTVYPIDLSDEDSLRTCEQHLLRFYQLGFRFFVLNDITASLCQELATATTGQQLSKRLETLKRVLPGATVLLGDLCPAETHNGFQGFRDEAPAGASLPRLARFAGLGGSVSRDNKLSPFQIPQAIFATNDRDQLGEQHKILDLSGYSFDANFWVSLETTIGAIDYPTSAVGVR